MYSREYIPVSVYSHKHTAHYQQKVAGHILYLSQRSPYVILLYANTAAHGYYRNPNSTHACYTFVGVVLHCIIITPKIRFPTYPAYQNMTFPHISYTYLAENRTEFYIMCRKFCPILQISYMYEIQIFLSSARSCNHKYFNII